MDSAIAIIRIAISLAIIVAAAWLSRQAWKLTRELNAETAKFESRDAANSPGRGGRVRYRRRDVEQWLDEGRSDRY